MAKDVHQMIRGMGMGARLITLLIDEVEKQGGSDEMLHFLTIERGRENLEKIAAFIVSLEWRVPLSVVKALVRKHSDDDRYVDSDEQFYWSLVLRRLGIPYVCFNSEAGAEENWPFPQQLRDLLDGKELVPNMPVEWEGEPHVLAGFAQFDKPVPETGQIIDFDDIHFVHLAPTRYFDFDS
jgi:hypothetical protein